MLRYTYIAPLVVDSDDVTITVRLTAVLDVVIPLFFLIRCFENGEDFVMKWKRKRRIIF